MYTYRLRTKSTHAFCRYLCKWSTIKYMRFRRQLKTATLFYCHPEIATAFIHATTSSNTIFTRPSLWHSEDFKQTAAKQFYNCWMQWQVLVLVARWLCTCAQLWDLTPHRFWLFQSKNTGCKSPSFDALVFGLVWWKNSTLSVWSWANTNSLGCTTKLHPQRWIWTNNGRPSLNPWDQNAVPVFQPLPTDGSLCLVE